MRKIAFINTLTSRGAERQVSHLMAGELFDKLILMDNICFYPVEESKLFILWPGYFSLSALKKLILLPVLLFRLVRFLKKDDVVISFLELSNYLNVLAGIFVGYRKLVSVRTLPSHQYGSGISGKVHRQLIRFLYVRSDLIISNSLGGKKDLEEKFNVPEEKIVVIPNGYPIDEIIQKSLMTLEKNDVQDMLYVAGLVEGKGHESLLEIFAEVKATGKDVRLIFLGDGYLKEKLRTKSHILGLNPDKDVIFAGQVKNPYAWMKQSDLFLFPSQWEGLPNALIEAGIVGATLVTADAPWGPREVLNLNLKENYLLENYPRYAKSGVLLPVLRPHCENYAKTKKIWAQTLDSLLSDQKSCEEYGCNAAKDMKRYDLSQALLQWKSLLSSESLF